MTLYFGLADGKFYTQRELALKLNRSKGRMSYLIPRAIREIRQKLIEKGNLEFTITASKKRNKKL